jgi:branched-chain amino acid transport system ATP-binding protein
VITLPTPSTDTRPLLVRFFSGLRHPVTWLRDLTGDEPIYPLLILFGLNAADELDRTAFAVLIPNIQEAFGLDISGILTVVGLVTLCGLLLQIPIAHFADRAPRVRLALIGASVWALFSVGTGLAVTVLMLGLMRTGSGVGKAVVDPTHNSLISDYYSVEKRPRVYSFHRAANAFGQFLGPLLGGLLAFYGAQWFGANIGWRLPFFVFAIPTVALVFAGMKMHEPVRGAQERRAMGASEGAIATEEAPPSLEEATRMIFKIETLRRIFVALPFLAAALIGFGSLAVFKYEALGLNEAQRGFASAAVEPFQLLGLYVGARIGTKLVARDPGLILRFIAVAAFASSLFVCLFALSPSIWAAMVANIGITVSFAIVAPGVLATLSLAIPPRARSVGFSMSSLFIIPGLIMLPIVGWVSDTWGVDQGMLLMAPVIAVGGLVIASSSKVVHRDIKNVWTSAATRSEMLYDRRQGKAKLLLVRNLDVRYGPVQILFDVDFEVDEGEIVALLGTNGAGKSTLLKSICGVVEADGGAVVFDGRDITHAPPHEIAGWGIAMVPGGQGVFPTLTVEENLSVASWIERKRDRKADATTLDAKMAEVLETFPVLEQRLDEPAANLSGGQQQMLALGMAFLSEPKLLVIDELSLGLAPVIVEQLLTIVRRIKEQGTTIILVEQSVNVALTLAETAYFMEKGEIRFHGPTAELLERPDVLRSVFLEGAEKGMASATTGANGAGNDTNGTSTNGADGVATNGHTVVGSTDDELLLGIGGTGGGAGNGNDGTGPEQIGSDRPADGVGEPAAVSPAPGAPAGGPVLELSSVSVRFGGIRAVDDVSMQVSSGEIIGIIGPNGAGKTTLFDVISGFTRADGGKVILNGNDITRLRPDKRARHGLGRSFQDARLFPALTVEETITIALERFVDVRDPFNAMLHLPAQQDSEAALRHRVDELIELMGIESFRSKFVRELSTGSRRVVDLACVLAHHPSVVLLDEPSSGIAQREAEALGPLILRIREALGASILVIEHDMPLITSVADRLVALELGHVITTGDPADVLAHPDVLASYLGSTEDVIARSGSRAGA